MENARVEREAALQRELSKHVGVTVKDFAGGMVILKADYRKDLLELWQSVKGRAFRGEMENAIPVGEWIKHVEDRLKAMPNLSIIYAKGVKESLDWHLNAPTWLVELDKRTMKLTPGPRAASFNVTNIPGIEWQGVKNPNWKWVLAPMSQAYNYFEALEKIEGVLWTEEAKEFTIAQIQTRASIDSIGKATEWPYDAGFVNDM